MLALSSSVDIFVASAPVDMRRAHDGLVALVQAGLRRDPSTGSLFVFFNKGGNRVKILYWDRNGYCLWYKRLEVGVFKRPKVSQSSYRLDASELTLLLEGIDLTHPRLSRFNVAKVKA